MLLILGPLFAAEILWSLSSTTPDEQRIEGLAVLVDGERDTEHFSCKHYGRRSLTQTFGKLRIVVRPPRLPLRSRSRSVKGQTSLLSGTAFAQPAPALFLA